MTTRELPREEWERLDGTDLGAVLNSFPHGSIVPIVVEDEHGAIVGCWAVLMLLHAEGLWIAPEHRGKGAVPRRLLTAMREAMRVRGVDGILTGAASDDVAQLLEKIGAVRVPYGSYYWPLAKGSKYAH